MNLDHIAVSVENIENSVSWYCKNLNAKVRYKDETWAMLSIGDTKIALTIGNTHPPHIAFSVSSTSLFPKGSKISTHRDESKYFYQKDPDGNTIEWIYYSDRLK